MEIRQTLRRPRRPCLIMSLSSVFGLLLALPRSSLPFSSEGLLTCFFLCPECSLTCSSERKSPWSSRFPLLPYLESPSPPPLSLPPLSSLYVISQMACPCLLSFLSFRHSVNLLGLVYLALHTVDRSTNVSSKRTACIFPTQNSTTNTFPVKIRGKGHRKLRPRFTNVF